MLDGMPHMLAPIKDVLDEGFALPLGEGLALERRVSSEQFRKTAPRAGAGAAFDQVRDRGRSQKKGPE